MVCTIKNIYPLLKVSHLTQLCLGYILRLLTPHTPLQFHPLFIQRCLPKICCAWTMLPLVLRAGDS